MMHATRFNHKPGEKKNRASFHGPCLFWRIGFFLCKMFFYLVLETILSTELYRQIYRNLKGKIDGFVKSPIFALRFILRHC